VNSLNVDHQVLINCAHTNEWFDQVLINCAHTDELFDQVLINCAQTYEWFDQVLINCAHTNEWFDQVLINCAHTYEWFDVLKAGLCEVTKQGKRTLSYFRHGILAEYKNIPFITTTEIRM